MRGEDAGLLSKLVKPASHLSLSFSKAQSRVQVLDPCRHTSDFTLSVRGCVCGETVSFRALMQPFVVCCWSVLTNQLLTDSISSDDSSAERLSHL